MNRSFSGEVENCNERSVLKNEPKYTQLKKGEVKVDDDTMVYEETSMWLNKQEESKG